MCYEELEIFHSTYEMGKRRNTSVEIIGSIFGKTNSLGVWLNGSEGCEDNSNENEWGKGWFKGLTLSLKVWKFRTRTLLPAGPGFKTRTAEKPSPARVPGPGRFPGYKSPGFENPVLKCPGPGRAEKNRAWKLPRRAARLDWTSWSQPFTRLFNVILMP